MTTELTEKLQKLFRILRKDLGTIRADKLFKEAGLRPIEIWLFINFQINLDDSERKAYEAWIIKLEEQNDASR